jgi:polysaccharide export outer membrane protein
MTYRLFSIARRSSAPIIGRIQRVALTAITVGLLMGATLVIGCSTGGKYVRVEDLPRTMQALGDYRIAPGDVLGIRVWNQPTMSLERTRVRDDGRIAVPFLQDVEAAGKTPAELAERLQVHLKTYVVSPVVTVTIEEQRPLRVSVTGEVTHPGVYELDRGAGVLSALAAAGSFTEFAHRDRIFVLRRGVSPGDPTPTRIRFRYEALTQGEKPAAGFQLKAGDVVVVE